MNDEIKDEKNISKTYKPHILEDEQGK